MPTTYWAFPPQTFTAWDANGDPVPSAKATITEAGTSTPLTTYTDTALTTPHAVPQVADANGVFAPIYINGPDELKIDVTDALDVQLPGYPVDNITGTPVGGLSATGIVFTPSATLPAVQVQAALNTLDTLTQRTKNRLIETETTGAGNAYNLDVPGTVSALADGDLFMVRADRDCTGAATLNVDTIGAKSWKVHDGSIYVDYASGEIRDGNHYLVEYDSGSDEFHTLLEQRRRATQAEAEAGTAIAVYMDALRVKQAVDALRVTRGTPIATTSGTAHGFTGIIAGADLIEFMLDGVSLSGTDDLIIQLGDAGGYETVGGYVSVASDAGAAEAGPVTGYQINRNSVGGDTWSGVLVFRRIDGNIWILSGGIENGSEVDSSAGSKTLTAELTQIQITRSGSDTFDAGSINILVQ